MRKAAASAPAQGFLKERSILIVDNDPDVVELLAGLLDEEGYRVRVAFKEEEALREIAHEPPDLVVHADLTADRELTNQRLPNLFHPYAGVETAVKALGHQNATSVAGMIERGGAAAAQGGVELISGGTFGHGPQSPFVGAVAGRRVVTTTH
jgi:hypothetical protein